MKGTLVKLVIFLFILNITVCEFNKNDKLWMDYMKEYEKRYDTKEAEMRRKNWDKAMKYIDEHNEGYSEGLYTYTVGLNDMSDWTLEEADHLCFLEGADGKNSTILPFTCDKRCQRKLPRHVDWRREHVISRVKNQSYRWNCGSCYAFGTVAVVEAHQALATGKLVELSAQEIVDCSHEFGNHGCNGGLPWRTLDYILQNNGLHTEKRYPYQSKEGQCRATSRKANGYISTYYELKKGDEKYLKAVIAHYGPVIAGVHATRKMKHYHGGFLCDDERKKDKKPNHAIAIVGYGVTNSTPYWLIKNSWGKKWGYEGYGLIIRDGKNHYGIASHTTIPIIENY